MSITTEAFCWTVPAIPKRTLRGKILRPGDADDRSPDLLPHVVILHGFKGFMDWGFFPELGRRFAERGIAAVLFNMSGCGVGEDPLELTETEAFARDTYSKAVEDVEHVRVRVRSGGLPGLDPDRAALLGHSRGGGVALIHGAEDGNYSSLVTWAAVDDLDRFDEATKEAWRRDGCIWIPNARTGQRHRMDLDLLEDLEHNRDRLSVLGACRRLTAPTLLVHGTADEAVPMVAVDRLAAEIPGDLARVLRIDGAGHTFGVGHPYQSSTQEWERATSASIDHIERSF